MACLRASFSEGSSMNEGLIVDLFVEDRAHEELIGAVLRRIARQEHRDLQLRARAARGGYPRVLHELDLYQKLVLKGLAGTSLPDVLVIAADANCHGLAARKKAIRRRLEKAFRGRTVLAVPDPHGVRGYLSDRQAFKQVVGVQPPAERRKCE